MSIGQLVCLSLCPLVTNVYCGKTADSIDMPFRVKGPRNQIPTVRGNFCGKLAADCKAYRDIAILVVEQNIPTTQPLSKVVSDFIF